MLCCFQGTTLYRDGVSGKLAAIDSQQQDDGHCRLVSDSDPVEAYASAPVGHRSVRHALLFRDGSAFMVEDNTLRPRTATYLPYHSKSRKPVAQLAARPPTIIVRTYYVSR